MVERRKLKRRVRFDSERLATFKTGSTMIDLVLGGGWALGRMVNLVGDKSTGKTLLAIEACANFARAFPKGTIEYLEVEAAFDGEYAEHLGLPAKSIKFPDEIITVEDLYEHLAALCDKRTPKSPPCLVIVDSLDALTDRSEQARDIDKGSYGANKAKQMSELFRRMNQKVNKAGITLMIISQVRENIGVTFGKSTTRSGGRALDFYASQIIWLAHLKRLKRTIRGNERVYGVDVRAKCEKNKIGPPFRECDFPIHFNYGVEDAVSMVDWCEKIKRAPKCWRSVEAMKKDKKKLPHMSYEDYEAVQKELRVFVRQQWLEIEDEFAPGRKKYRG